MKFQKIFNPLLLKFFKNFWDEKNQIRYQREKAFDLKWFISINFPYFLKPSQNYIF
jgi:hypothetical protein